MKTAALSTIACLAVIAWTPTAVSTAGEGSSISKVNSSVRAQAGQTYDSLSTVNGSVHLERGVTAHSARTVNGGITLEDQARVGSASTVNGGVEVGPGGSIEREASTVNGRIRLAQGVQVGGAVTTVNGDISLTGATVGGGLETVAGDIDLADGARVRGDIVVRKPNNNGWNRKKEPVKVHVCSTCVVEGDLRFERPVELQVDSGGKIGKVIGEEVTRR